MNSRTLPFLALLFLALFGLWGCEDCSFQSSNIQYARLVFLDENQEAKDTIFDYVYGIGVEDSLYSSENDALSQFELPLFFGDTRSAFVFVKDTLRDTLFLNYEKNISVYSPDCGYDVQIRALQTDAQFTSFDSVRVLHSVLSSENDYDLEILP
jgi:hypothetical protein